VDWGEWIGRSVEVTELVAEAPVRRLAATLDHDGAHWPAGVLPPLGHWLFGLPDAPRSALGADGHPAKGGFLPPIAQPRRMWAGGRLSFRAPISVGATLTRRTTIAVIDEKPGRPIFVTLRHDIRADGVLAVEEEQDLVYLPISAPGTPKAVEHPAPHTTREMVADEALLFRFSALTFNAHRIHYDLAYAREVELYPALVVHGPLQAMLLIDHALREGVAPARFAFRARAPLHAGRRFTLARADEALWVRDDQGTTTMTATLA
jgi:3-methylfumaryl-CoA hydratase